MDKHYTKDCDHEFDGWEATYSISRKTGEEYESGGTTICKHCGLSAMAHDMANGP